MTAADEPEDAADKPDAAAAPVSNAAAAKPAAGDADSDGGGSTLSWIALALGALGALLGGAALLRAGRLSSGKS